MSANPGSVKILMIAIGLLSASACSAFLGGIRVGESAEFYLNRSGCGRTTSCSISCSEVEDALLWSEESSPAPSLQPATALQVSALAVAAELGAHSDPYPESISLTRCGRGWVYVIRYSAVSFCEATSSSDFGTIAVGVFMNGTVFFPPTGDALGGDAKCVVRDSTDGRSQ
jgi:hypothetical protein